MICTHSGIPVIIKSDDVNTLTDYLSECAYKWREIGGALKFRPGELENINQSGKDPQQRLTKLLEDWAQWPTKKHPTDPTLESLCNALYSSMVGLGAVAADLNKGTQ